MFFISGVRGGLILVRERKLAIDGIRSRLLAGVGSCRSEGFGKEISVLLFGVGKLTSSKKEGVMMMGICE